MTCTVFARSASGRRAAIVSGALAALALLLFAGPAGAAPQPLGLVATVEPVPMRCGADGCAAQLSAFCLQRDRLSPGRGMPYRVAGGAGLVLHLIDADGARRTVRAEGLVHLASARGNTAIEARVTAADMAALGALEMSVEVGPLVTLLPAVKPGDDNPITAAEAEFAAGPARRLAADIFDSRGALGESLNLLDRAINAIATETRLGDEARRALWHRVAETPLEAAAGSTAPAADVFAACLDDLARRMVFGLRNCLEGRRDELLIRANTDLWHALEAGS